MKHIDARAGPHCRAGRPVRIPNPDFIHSPGIRGPFRRFGVGGEALNGGVKDGSGAVPDP